MVFFLVVAAQVREDVACLAVDAGDNEIPYGFFGFDITRGLGHRWLGTPNHRSEAFDFPGAVLGFEYHRLRFLAFVGNVQANGHYRPAALYAYISHGIELVGSQGSHGCEKVLFVDGIGDTVGFEVILREKGAHLVQLGFTASIEESPRTFDYGFRNGLGGSINTAPGAKNGRR